MGGSEYRNAADFSGADGDPYQDVSFSLTDSDTADIEYYARLNFYRLLGRTAQLRVTGNATARTGLREFVLDVSPHRRARYIA